MALKTSSKMARRIEAAGRAKGVVGGFMVAGGVFSVASAPGAGLLGIGLAGAGLASIAKGMSMVAAGRSARARATAVDTLSRGQTQMGALYGQKPGSAYLNASAEKRASAPGGRVVGGASPVPGRGWAAGRGFANQSVQQAAQSARRRMGK